ncbi:MAG: CBS domain-containing protein [Bacteroidota bacterium]|nr:CBS domain-containing protein [Bacteroidota bacterium]
MIAKEILAKKIEKQISKVHSINENLSAFEVVVILDKYIIGSLIVVNNNSKVTGIITEKDILYKCYNSDISLKEKKVKDLMTTIDNLIIGKEDDNAEYLRNVMTNKRIRHMPIFSDDNNLVGIISTGDIIKAELESMDSEIKLLKEHIQNPYGINIYSKE